MDELQIVNNINRDVPMFVCSVARGYANNVSFEHFAKSISHYVGALVLILVILNKV